VYDCRKKRIEYRPIGSLTHSVIVKPEQDRVVHDRRSPEGARELRDLRRRRASNVELSADHDRLVDPGPTQRACPLPN
jgi:hypothetical protein